MSCKGRGKEGRGQEEAENEEEAVVWENPEWPGISSTHSKCSDPSNPGFSHLCGSLQFWGSWILGF